MPEMSIANEINEGTAADAALLYSELGIEPIPLLTRGKHPATNWGTVKLHTPEDIAEHFDAQSNVGVALGERSGGIVDLDFDTPEAVPVADVIFAKAVAMGRVDAPRSHRFVRCSGTKTKRFQVTAKIAKQLGLQRATILEVRGDGAQTMVAPSIHPMGQKVIWYGDPSKIPTIDYDELQRSAGLGEWRVPVLNGIIATPTLRADGSILQQPGFDLESGLLYDPRGVEYAPVQEAPSRAQALEALGVFMRPFREFPFADEIAKGVLVAAGLTALIRRSLPTAPMFAVDAPTAGSGKTYIAQTIGIIATGHIPTLIAQGKSDEEDEKRISTVLIAGDPIVVVDNCERPISGDTLCGVLTTETWGARILGKSELAKVPTNILFIATGNNLVVAGDMARRILVCRLDPRMENPEQAEYDFDPRTEAAEHRTEIVSAGLTILRAFIAAGRPKQSKPLGSFNEWNLVRDAVIWLGLPDPSITVERNKVDDPLKSELSNLLELWVAALGEKEVSLADIGIEADQSRSPQISELHQALASMSRNGQFNTKSIGRLLRKHIDRIVNGLALRKNSGPSGSLLYRVEILDRKELTDADEGKDETEFPF